MLLAVGEHAVGDAGLDEQTHAVALEDAGPVGGLDVAHRSLVEHEAVDPGPVQQVREHETGWTAADDRDLRA